MTLNLVPVRTAGELCDRNHADETVSPMFSNALRRFQLRDQKKRMILTHGRDIDAVSHTHIRAVGLLMIGDVGDPLDLTTPVLHLLQSNKRDGGAAVRIPYVPLRGEGLQFEKGKMTENDAARIYRTLKDELLVNTEQRPVPSLYISRDGHRNDAASVRDALNDTLVVIQTHTRQEERERFDSQLAPVDESKRAPLLHDAGAITAYSVYFVLKKLDGAVPPSALLPAPDTHSYFAWAPVNTLQLETTTYLISNHPTQFSDYVARFLWHGHVQQVRVASTKIPYVEKDQSCTMAAVHPSGAIREDRRRQPMLHAVGPLAAAYMNAETPRCLEDLLITDADAIFVLATAFKIQISAELHYAANAQLHSLTFGMHLDDYPSAHCRDHDIMAYLADSHFSTCSLPTHATPIKK